MSEILKALMGERAEAPGVRAEAVRVGPEVGARMKELHEALERDLSETRVTGEAGAGMARVTMSLEGAPVRVEVSPDLHVAGMREPLEDLLLAALQDAHRRAGEARDKLRSAHMEKVGRLLSDAFQDASD